MNRRLCFTITLLIAGCSASRGPEPGSQTHFLDDCKNGCAAPFSCLCGVCTIACDGDATCQQENLAGASCLKPAADSCQEVATACDVECAADADCSELGSAFGCEAGRCRSAPLVTLDAGLGFDAGPGDAGPSADGGPRPSDAAVRDAAVDAGSICDLPPEVGSCEAAIPRFYHDKVNGCRSFTYGGCDGNANNFESVAECQAACPQPPNACEIDATDPSVPGVTVHIESTRCEIPMGEAQLFRYSIEVSEPIPYMSVDSGGSCGRCQGYSDNPLSLVGFAIGVPPVRYCECLGGCCPPTTAQTVTLAPGTYDADVNWPGRQWDGPSDTGEPLGDPFPLGSYDVTVTVDVPGVGKVTAALPIQVTDGTGGALAVGCEVDGVTYPSGASGIGDPYSCNSCECLEGQLICTEINCPNPCPSGSAPATSCARCGPADGCEVVRTGCHPTCQNDVDCNGGGFCVDGTCRVLCG